jgi:orotidine-5'-phosphate decarboxylase
MLEAAMAAAAEAGRKRPKVVAVTVLTSLDDGDLAAVGQHGPAADQVLRLARLAEASGLDGVVCSPHEVGLLRREIGDAFALVVPGVRPDWAGADDQKRVMTPGEAIAAGADHLVIGRPITKSADPVGAARRIAVEIADARR